MAFLSILDRERTVAPADYNRWLVPPAALCVHLCIGEVYAFSVFNLPLTRLVGKAAGGQALNWSSQPPANAEAKPKNKIATENNQPTSTNDQFSACPPAALPTSLVSGRLNTLKA